MAELRVYMPELVDDAERRRILSEDCDGKEEGYYTRDLSEEEILERREELVKVSLDLRQKEQEKKDWVDSWKLTVKPKVEMKELLLNELKSRQVEGSGNLYLIRNLDSGMMEYYAATGEFIKERKLKPSEKQIRMPLGKVN